MKYTTTTTALLFAVAVTAQQDSSPSEYSSPVEKACNPNNASGMPDFNAPCNAVKAIEYQCIYGPDYLAQAQAVLGGSNKKRQSDNNDDDRYGTDADISMQSNSTQRTCICESQFFDQVNGCSACYKAHGDLDNEFDASIIDDKAIASLSSAYCAVSATPSVGLADFLLQWADQYNSSHPATGSATSTMSDPIGNKTAVSLYYTPSVTGSAAWVIAEQTSGASSGMGTFASQNTVSGMIMPTASANNDAAQTTGSDSNGSSSTSSGGAAVATAAGMGMLGLAGLVAML